MPAPLNVPDGAWLPVSVTEDVFEQYAEAKPVKLTEGKALMVTDTVLLCADKPLAEHETTA